jgi:putative chitinase
MSKYGIDTPVRQAAFLAQLAHESSRFQRLEENMRYSAKRLTQVWPSRFRTLEAALPFANNPEALANNVYANRMGNVNPGDGWRYRGRGLKQLTGRNNYKAYQAASGVAVLTSPDLLLQPPHAADSGAWFWRTVNGNVFADRKDWGGLTRVINGGVIGLADRIALTHRALRALGA